jgi:hypothetical protein
VNVELVCAVGVGAAVLVVMTLGEVHTLGKRLDRSEVRTRELEADVLKLELRAQRLEHYDRRVLEQLEVTNGQVWHLTQHVFPPVDPLTFDEGIAPVCVQCAPVVRCSP